MLFYYRFNESQLKNVDHHQIFIKLTDVDVLFLVFASGIFLSIVSLVCMYEFVAFTFTDYWYHTDPIMSTTFAHLSIFVN